MKSLNNHFARLRILQDGKLNFLASSKIMIFVVFLIPFILINCEKEVKKLVTPDENEFPDCPINVNIVVDDNSIILTWDMNNTKDILCYHVYRKDSITAKMDLIDSCFVKKYTDNNVKNGKIYYYQIAAVNNLGYEGKRSQEVFARPNVFDLIIEDGKDYINTTTVTLKLIAPFGTRYMRIANDSLFSNSSWEYYSLTKNWTLPQGDGLKYVYAKFRDNEGNENKSLIHDKITLDTQAAIGEISESSNGEIIAPGESIHFVLITGEAQGKALVDIGRAKTGIELFDNGNNGDSLEDDGKYEIDYKIPSDLEVVNAVITGHFTDRVGNVASDVTATGRLTIQRAPTAVTLYQPVITGNEKKSLKLIWSQNYDNDFANYQLFRSKNAGVDTNSTLLTTSTIQTETSYTDTDVQKDNIYFYKVFVYDNVGLASGSNEVNKKININEPPTPVTLQPVIPIGNSTNSLNLSWSKNEDEDYSSYKIFRDKSPGVDSTALLVTTITDQNITNYDDKNLQQNTAYYYRVYVYDAGGLSSGSNEEMGKTNTNEPPLAVILYPASPITNSTTSLNLNWSKNEETDFASYKIYRGDSAGVSDTTSSLIATITNQNTTSYDDTGLKEDTNYYYRIYVYDNSGLFTASNEEMGKTNVNEPPLPVTLYKPSAIANSTSSLNINWSKNEDVDFASYKIFRSMSSGVDDSTSVLVKIISDQNITSHEDANLEENTEYHYRVFVYDTRGLSAGSNEESGKTNANEPPTPVVFAQPFVVNSETLRLSWSQNNDEDFDSYIIYRSESSPVDTVNAAIAIINNRQTTEYNDTNLISNKTYYYRVFVTDEGGLSSGSNEVKGTPEP